MDVNNYICQKNIAGVSGLFFASGDFGVIDGRVDYKREEKNNKIFFSFSNEKIALRSEFTKEKNGVVVRRDYLTNLTKENMKLNKLVSRFCLDGNKYDIYTQYNGWQHESDGHWQRLVTQIVAASCGIRTCDGAAPIMALNNLYNNKITVFHLLPNAQWKMVVKKYPLQDKEVVVLETGFEDSGLNLEIHSKEEIELPTIIMYNAENKTDLDAFKLHYYFNETYPRKKLPIVYNSWLYCFDKIDIDQLIKQADCASKMGMEAFMVDAGWFGNGDSWFDSVSDWEENMVSGPKGRLLELSEYVRSKGMIFGLWFEPERAPPRSEAVKTHPDYYIDNAFLDFSKKEAREYMLEIIFRQIEKYKIGWLKFDFNDTIPFDPSGNSFYRYMQGQRIFIESIREKYPNMYITGCASGGYRMDLGQAILFDSFWFTDNQGPMEGIRIIKDTLKRFPTCLIERWNAQNYIEGLPIPFTEPAKKMQMIHCNNATWDYVVGINDSFSEEFMLGGPMGFTCDINGFSEYYKKRWSNVISQYKNDREFFKTAVSRILVDKRELVVIEYSDMQFCRCYVQVFTKISRARDLIIYPKIDENAQYLYDGKTIFGKEIQENGIKISKLNDNECLVISLVKR